MFAPLTTALILFAGIILYAAIHSLLNAYYQRQTRIYIFFSLMCIFICGYILARQFALHSNNPLELVAAQRWGIAAAILFFLSQLFFISEYSNWRPRWLLIPMASTLLVLLILNQTLPYGLGYSASPIYQQMLLPWGEILTDTRILDKTTWWYLGWLTFMGIFAFQFAASFRLRKLGEKQRGNNLLWSGGVFFAVMMWNLLVNFSVVNFTQLAEFGFIALIIMINLHLNREARTTALRADIAEDKWTSTKHELDISEARHRQLLNTLPYGVQEIDKHGNITYSNPAHDRLFGYEPGQMLGMSIFNLPANKDEAAKLRDYIKYIYESQPEPATYIKQDRRKNGELFDIKIDWSYLQDEDGKVTGLISILTDITAQVKADIALRESEEKFRQLAENINKVFYIRDLASNRMLYVSPAYTTIWGRSVQKLYDDPRDFINSIHPDDKDRVLQLLSEQNHRGNLFNAEYRIIDSQGAIRWIHARTYPINSDSGNVTRVAGIVEDIRNANRMNIYCRKMPCAYNKSCIARMICSGSPSSPRFVFYTSARRSKKSGASPQTNSAKTRGYGWSIFTKKTSLQFRQNLNNVSWEIITIFSMNIASSMRAANYAISRVAVILFMMQVVRSPASAAWPRTSPNSS